jgi:D-sedoheptulose 7-phosphate isomerase
MGHGDNRMIACIVSQLEESAAVKRRIVETCLDELVRAAEMLVATYRQGHKVLLCGNGGSAADAQHLAAELVAKLTRERNALPALALTVNASLLTSIPNDSSFNQVFARQVEALGQPGDTLIALSTSGCSANVNAAVLAARERGMHTIALTGKGGGELATIADLSIVVPADNTQRIQEGHITVGHILCDIVEATLFE